MAHLHIFPLQGSLLKNPITLGRLLGAPGLGIEILMAVDNRAPSFLIVTYCTCQVMGTFMPAGQGTLSRGQGTMLLIGFSDFIFIFK